MPTKTLTTEHRPALPIMRETDDRVREAESRQAKRVRRLTINAVAWGIGTLALTTLWAAVEWSQNGAFERFAHEGNAGDWNPTLWALAVGLWGLVIGIMALRVHFERPVTVEEIDRAAAKLDPRAHGATLAECRRYARWRLDAVRRLKFHVSAWLLAMIVISPLNALIEWQDNGAFERLSGDSQPGSWDPWFLYVGGIWAIVIALYALYAYADRPTPRDDRQRLLPQ
jgi:hypothetical protein